MKWQLLRRFTQSLALAFISYAAISAHWRNFKVSHNQARLVGLMKGEGWAELYALNERVLSWFGEPLSVSDGFLGVPWSATFAGFPFTDPLSIVALGASGQVAPASMWLGALLPLGIALVGGRVFCSFLCPARLIFEIGSAVRMGLLRLGLYLPTLKIPRIGGWVAVGAVIAAATAGIAVFHVALPYLALSSGIAQAMLTGSVAGFALFGVMLAFDVFVAPGQICRSLCPTGAILGFVGRASPLRLEKTEKTDCGSCTLCQRVCPYGLFPGEENHHPVCDTCGRCARVCPADKLAPTLRLGRKRCS